MRKGTIIFSRFIIIVFFLFLISGLHYGFYLILLNTDAFALKEIKVIGNRFFPTESVIINSGIVKGINIMQINLKEVASRLKKNSFVKDVEVKRIFPDKIEIIIKEKDAVANFNYNGSYFVIDKDGVFLTNGIYILAPYLEVDYIPLIENGKVKDEFITFNLANIFDYGKLDKFEKILIKKDSGIFINLKNPKNTTFFAGKKILDENILDRIFYLADYITSNNINIKLVDLRKENAIGISNN
ncbi:MAG: FtsQ-type POTRA domain-containing protein [Brevinematales bacterium]|nr:FtsQ-type POTRA domain-containing protein [Brevinematales bacterium]